MQNDLGVLVNKFKSKILTEYFHGHIKFRESSLEQFLRVFGIKMSFGPFQVLF